MSTNEYKHTWEHYMYYAQQGLEWGGNDANAGFSFNKNDLDRWKDLYNELNGVFPYKTNYYSYECN